MMHPEFDGKSWEASRENLDFSGASLETRWEHDEKNRSIIGKRSLWCCSFGGCLKM